MKAIRILALMAALLTAFSSYAEIRAKAGRYTVVGLLSMRKGEMVRLFVNPTAYGRYVLNVKNPSAIAQLMKRKEFSGPVRVEMDVLKTAGVRVLKITPARIRRLPVYDGNLVAVAGGNG